MFYKVKIHLNDQEKRDELVQQAIHDFDCAGVENYSLEEKEVDEILGERAYSGGDVPESVLDEVTEAAEGGVVFYFTGRPDSFIKFLGDIPYTLEECDEQDWEMEWRKTYSPVQVTKELTIVPEWMRGDHFNKDSLFIYPGQGFGTGRHETTFLCLKILMEDLRDTHLESCLDFGCGSGILGLAYLKFWNGRTIFCDIDKSALDNTVQNIALNFEGKDLSHCSVILRERLGSQQKSSLVFANILLSALKEEYSILSSSVMDGGYLIVSGLLLDQVEELKSHFLAEKKFQFMKTLTQGDWAAILFQKGER